MAGGSRGPVRWREREATRAVRALKAAGLEVGRLELSPDGKINVYPRGANEAREAVDPSLIPGAKDQLWYGDITYIFTMSGWAYLATVIDGYSRKVVGWSVADHMREELVIDAFRMAVANRLPGPGRWSSIPTAEASILAGRSVMCASVMVLYRRSGRPGYASTMRRRSRGTRRSRKSSSTCMHGRTSSM